MAMQTLRMLPLRMGIALFALALPIVATADEPQHPPQPLYIADADGGNARLLLAVAGGEYDAMGSPEWSSDGKRIAFDAWRASKGETSAAAHVFVMNADGTDVKNLGPGAMPTFSPGGHRLVVSRYGGGDERGVWVLNMSGADPVWVAPEGWSGHWSPDGHKLAWTTRRDGGATIEIMDIIEGTRHTVFEGDEQTRYTTVYWNFCWSPDSEALCFKGRLRGGGDEVAIVDARGSSHGFKVRLPEVAAAEDLSWHPDGRRILLSMQSRERKARQLFTFDPATDDPPQLLPRQDPARNHLNGSWSPDGRHVVFTIREKPDAPQE